MFVVIMNLSFYISNRLFFTKKGNNRYTKPILTIGTLAVTLSVSVMLLSIMITKGFKNQITEKIIGFGGSGRFGFYFFLKVFGLVFMLIGTIVLHGVYFNFHL